eukprot:CAMPEP_0198327408 /NCGR_PEP_ID=MMETSP1450-20131203/14683_1 /TAXON_ID=753684 ORGANISM="Madagascaria erythrocladiodes, Strain CCMP3234" /NCGR_SAMPLE_ID=MMETSP1450 /ASSEMBLY_ACC=CAM_ASM_001115 /LENGTH=314 /DNA_ID=CAMNT_0044031455 /DNA_START=15 /DNA_END=955 /DNA_ORIENTATION=+
MAITVTENAADFDDQLCARFGALTFPHGTRLRTTRMTFRAQVQAALLGHTELLNLESNVSGDLVVKTNENQWDECEGILMKRSLWSSPDVTRVPWLRVCNIIQHHYLIATRQWNPLGSTDDQHAIDRPLLPHDLAYIHRLCFDNGDAVTQKQFEKFWLWFGPTLHKIRYQRHLCPLWRSGKILGFLTRAESEHLLLQTRSAGAFLLRFSERVAGQFAVSYVVHTSGRGGGAAGGNDELLVKHYLMRDTDTAGAKKTLPDFLRGYTEFQSLMALATASDADDYGGGEQRRYETVVKDDALRSFYSKRPTDRAFNG